MIREKLFAFAVEQGWYEVLEVAYNTHSLFDIAGKLNKKESRLEIELQAMYDMGLLQLSGKSEGGWLYMPTILGIKFLQEQNKKKGRTYSCLLCGTTTGTPHLCPCFYPELK